MAFCGGCAAVSGLLGSEGSRPGELLHQQPPVFSRLEPWPETASDVLLLGHGEDRRNVELGTRVSARGYGDFLIQLGRGGLGLTLSQWCHFRAAETEFPLFLEPSPVLRPEAAWEAARPPGQQSRGAPGCSPQLAHPLEVSLRPRRSEGLL